MFRRSAVIAALTGCFMLSPCADTLRRLAFAPARAAFSGVSHHNREPAITMLSRPERVAKFYADLVVNAGGALVTPSAAKAGNPKTDPEVFFANIKDATDIGGAKLLHFGPQRRNGLTEKVNVLDEKVAEMLRERFPDLYVGLKPTMMLDGLKSAHGDVAADFGLLSNQEYLMPYIEQGDVDGVYLHPESHAQPAALLAAAIKEGCVPGVVVNPSTPVSAVEPLLAGSLLQTRIKLAELHHCLRQARVILEDQLFPQDLTLDQDEVIVPGVVVIMLVNPGYGGLKYERLALTKMRQIAEMAKTYGVPCPIFEIDGGVSMKNAQQFVDAAAQLEARLVFVAGAVFKEGVNKKEFINELEELRTIAR